jgi:hypothetical protein
MTAKSFGAEKLPFILSSLFSRQPKKGIRHVLNGFVETNPFSDNPVKAL